MDLKFWDKALVVAVIALRGIAIVLLGICIAWEDQILARQAARMQEPVDKFLHELCARKKLKLEGAGQK